ncbi:MAG: glycosyltransferase [Clostridia bacterium]
MNKKINIYENRKEKLNIENSKKVSVIIPNYNYQDFIIERIDSILMQTYPIYELLILDDCSTDESVKVIEEKIKTITDIPVQFVKNETNSGCVFKQWKKGFDLAKGDYIWIAEADDSAENNFVEELIKAFEDEKVVLSYCESARIDENNLLIRAKSDDLYDMCRTGEWDHSYIKEGKEEIIEHLSVTNTILNVSSVIWKKEEYSDIFAKAGEFKVAGDWYIYYNILKNGKIAWNSKALNYYRKHSKSVCTTVKADIEFKEICRLQDEISSLYEIPEEIKEKQELRRSFIMPMVSEEVLNDYRNTHHDPNAKKRIAWVIPHPGKGSGGHRTIIQNVNALLRAGYDCDIYVEDDNVSTAQMVKDKINEYYEPCEAGVYVGIRMRKDYDIVFATGWQIVEFVRNVPARHKAYFIQDFEPWFFPMGDQYIITENSYRYGFMPVTIGKWLAHKMLAEYNNPVEYFDFGADLKVYKKLEHIEKENAICFVYQPEKSRRCDYIGLKALRIVKTLRPDIQIYLYGSNMPATFDFECQNLNIIPIEKCNELYNRCKVGVCMSASNPSRIPFEMMAAGLPVVEMHKENNIYDMPDGGVLLARTTPEAIASAIIYLVDHPEEREKMSQFGLDYMKDYPLERGFEQFLKAVDDMLNTPYDNRRPIEPVYNKPPFEATKEAIDMAKQLQPVIHIDDRGPVYRFLRRTKRKVRDVLVKMGIKK